MVFNPTSPIRVFGRKVANPSRPAATVSLIPSSSTVTQLPTPAAPSSTMGSTWRDGMSRLRHLSRDRDPTPQEISRWSKTTTESEASEAAKDQPPKPRNVLKKKTKQNRESKETTNSSPVDPSYDPTTKRFLTEGDLGMPRVAVTGPIEPKTFYDSSSDESSPESPIIQRASSVRVAKPSIVQHNNASGGSVPRLYAPHSTPTEAQNGTVKQPRDSNGNDTSTSTGGKGPHQGENPTVPKDALKALEGRESDADTLTALPQVISLDYRPEQNNAVKETIIEFPDTPGRVEALSTLPTPMGGFGSVRLPRSGADTTSTSGTFVSTAASIDGLRSNPPTELDKKLSRAISAPVRNSRRVTIRPADLIITQTNSDHKLLRENIVSTPYPARHSSIGEIDEIVAANSGSGNVSKEESRTSFQLSKSFRRSRSIRKKSLSNSQGVKVVNTEKPQSYTTPSERLAEKIQAPEIPLSTKPVLGASTPAKSDRFPSPVAPEVLFLDLRLARHPSAKTTIEIEITDRTSFDDEQLFAIIQKSYRSQLLGVARRLLSARVLSYASPNADFSTSMATTNTVSSPLRLWHPGSPLPPLTPGGPGAHEIDGADFIKHLHNPRLGRRRKMWLLWLRNNQQTESFGSRRTRTRHAGTTAAGADTSPSDGASPVFSFMGHSRSSSRDSDPYVTVQPPPTASSFSSTPAAVTFGSSGANMGVGGSLSANPSVKIPRMPFQPPTFPMWYRSGSRSHFGAGIGARESAGASGPPCLHLHYTFSMRRIAAVLATLLFLAIFTSVMWILFGLPGRGADQGNTTTLVEGEEYVVSWKRDAQSRAGVGVVMGIAVLLGGIVCEVVWVWGSWVLI
ncbi:hypothetical protein RBB50_007831 [Rhinocladiella similis]